MSILNPLFGAVAWVLVRIHAVLAYPFGPDSGLAWGLSIVLLVMLMRLIMVPLFVKQVRSQRKMQAHMPQLQEIRKRYKHDKQRLNEETMKFYKENGINPLGGCLPLAAQLPVFWALFDVLRAIAEGHVGQYGLTKDVIDSAKQAHIFGATLADRFLFPVAGESLSSRIVILIAVLISAGTTFLTMRQSAKRGMLNQTAPDPDQPGAAMAASLSKNMMYVAPFFALTGLYWQFGLVIYWVTTNLWTLGQQHFLFRNLPVVGSATVGSSAAQAASGSAGAAAKGGTAKGGQSARSAAAGGTAKPKPPAAKVSGARAGANGAAGGGVPGASGAGGGPRGLLRFGKGKQEDEPAQAGSPAKTVRQQPVRQTRSKRSGNSGKR